MHTEHYDIYFYPAEAAAVADAARMAERWYARHSLTLRDTFSKKPIVLYADNPAFQQTNVIPGFLGEGIGGVTEPSRSRALLFFSGAYFDDDHVLGHELVHVFQFDIAGAARGGLNNLDRLPQWSIEGMAEYLSLGRDDPNTTMFMRDAALRNDLPTIKKLNNPKYFAYRYGEALWAFIGGRFGDSTIATIYRAALRSGLEPAVRGVLGITTDSLSKLWIAAIKEQYLADAKTRTLPKDLGTRLLRPASKYGDFDVAPSISPDGKEVAFITSRDLFSFDLYIADAATGRTIRRLTSPNSNPHFDALSFSNSSGSWSPDGKYLAVPAYAQGVVDVEIFNTRNGNIEQHIAPPGVGQVLSIAWSPDGKQLAFSGLSGGWSDLYLYDLGAKRTIQLMHDRAAQFQPAWSPDGRTLAFAADSGPGTSFSLLTYRPLQIALMDMTNPDHPVRMLSLFGGKAKHINPQFTPDGQSLYFVSDPDGIPDIYRVALATGTIQRVTRVATGITGITGSSPTRSRRRPCRRWSTPRRRRGSRRRRSRVAGRWQSASRIPAWACHSSASSPSRHTTHRSSSTASPRPASASPLVGRWAPGPAGASPSSSATSWRTTFSRRPCRRPATSRTSVARRSTSTRHTAGITVCRRRTSPSSSWARRRTTRRS